MSHLSLISDNTPADAAWERYSLLVREANKHQRWGDRPHVEAMLRAYEDFRTAFLASEKS
jgi:hypothetical protein